MKTGRFSSQARPFWRWIVHSGMPNHGWHESSWGNLQQALGQIQKRFSNLEKFQILIFIRSSDMKWAFTQQESRSGLILFLFDTESLRLLRILARFLVIFCMQNVERKKKIASLKNKTEKVQSKTARKVCDRKNMI